MWRLPLTQESKETWIDTLVLPSSSSCHRALGQYSFKSLMNLIKGVDKIPPCNFWCALWGKCVCSYQGFAQDTRRMLLPYLPTSVRSWMQAMVELERSGGTKSTTGKPGKVKELQMSNSNLKQSRQCRTGLYNWISTASSFPALLLEAWAACVLSPAWISASVLFQ